MRKNRSTRAIVALQQQAKLDIPVADISASTDSATKIFEQGASCSVTAGGD